MGISIGGGEMCGRFPIEIYVAILSLSSLAVKTLFATMTRHMFFPTRCFLLLVQGSNTDLGSMGSTLGVCDTGSERYIFLSLFFLCISCFLLAPHQRGFPSFLSKRQIVILRKLQPPILKIFAPQQSTSLNLRRTGTPQPPIFSICPTCCLPRTHRLPRAFTTRS